MSTEQFIELFLRIAIPYLMGKVFDLIAKRIQSKQQSLQVEVTTARKLRTARRE